MVTIEHTHTCAYRADFSDVFYLPATIIELLACFARILDQSGILDDVALRLSSFGLNSNVSRSWTSSFDVVNSCHSTREFHNFTRTCCVSRRTSLGILYVSNIVIVNSASLNLGETRNFAIYSTGFEFQTTKVNVPSRRLENNGNPKSTEAA